MTGLIIAFVTTNTREEASSLAKKMVKERLAACASIIDNIRSIYEWDGEMHDEKEYLLIIKAPKSNTDKLKKFISENHSYEVPEFIALEATDVLPDYLRWVMDSAKSS